MGIWKVGYPDMSSPTIEPKRLHQTSRCTYALTKTLRPYRNSTRLPHADTEGKNSTDSALPLKGDILCHTPGLGLLPLPLRSFTP
jgi:hypothetical protein